MCTGDQLNTIIDSAVTIVSPTPPSSVLTYSWDTTKSVMIVNLDGNAALYPGNLPATTTAGPGTPTWLNNAISWSSLLTANPNARLVDGGMPAGAIMLAVLLVSGDSGATTPLFSRKSGKKITAFSVNGKMFYHKLYLIF